MSYTHLTLIERAQLELLVQQGQGIRAIGRILGRPARCISREIRRNGSIEAYQAERAQEAYVSRRQASKPKGKYTPELAAEIQSNLEQTFSPEQIEHSRKRQGNSPIRFKTIYTWLYMGKLQGDPRCSDTRGSAANPLRNEDGLRSESRFTSVPRRCETARASGIGSLDTVVSSRGKSKACVATFVEQKARFYQAIRMPDRTALSMEIAFGVLAG